MARLPKILPSNNVYIPVGAADNGTSIGAAFFVWNQFLKQPRQFVLNHAYWGSEFSDEECLLAIAVSRFATETLRARSTATPSC